MDLFIATIEALGDTDYERAQRLRDVRPHTIWRWRHGISQPRLDHILNNITLAEGALAEARRRMEQSEHVTEAAA